MDNKLWSQVKRGLKITWDYFAALLIFGVFSSIALSIYKDNLEKGILIFSILIFLIMFSMIYTGMSDTAIREKRPQYNINPPPYKGFIYGIIGILPLLVIQLFYYVINVPEELLTLKRRILQAFSSPVYWLAQLISADAWAYHLVLLVIPVIAGLGYLAGYNEFYILKRLKIFTKRKQIPNKRQTK